MKIETPGSAFNTSLVNLHFTLGISKVPRSQEPGGAMFLVISDHFFVRCKSASADTPRRRGGGEQKESQQLAPSSKAIIGIVFRLCWGTVGELQSRAINGGRMINGDGAGMADL